MVGVRTIGHIFNIDLGGKGEFVAIIKNNQYILARIVWILASEAKGTCIYLVIASRELSKKTFQCFPMTG